MNGMPEFVSSPPDHRPHSFGKEPGVGFGQEGGRDGHHAPAEVSLHKR